MSDWRNEVRSVVEAWSRVSGAERPAWVTLGRARREADDGWFAVDTRTSADAPQDLDDLRVVAGRPAAVVACVIDEVQAGDGVLRLRLRGPLPDGEVRIERQTRPPSFLIEKLRERLEVIGDTELARMLAEGRLSGAPQQLNLDEPATFNPAQRQALAACRTPGLRVVWGPPGTGKTRLLAEAIDRLVADGARVLLVSSTNVALDNALHGVVEGGSAMRPGTMVRIGTPHLPEIAANDGVCLDRLIAARLAEIDARRDAVIAQLAPLDAVDQRLAALDRKLDDSDADALREARQRIDAARRRAKLEDERTAVAHEVEVAQRRVDRATAQFERSEDERWLAGLADDVVAAHHARDRLDTQRRALERRRVELNADTSPWGRLRRLRTPWAITSEARLIAAQLERAEIDVRRAEEEWLLARVEVDGSNTGRLDDLPAAVERHRRIQPGVDAALAELRHAERELRAAERRCADIEAALAALDGVPAPTAADHELVAASSDSGRAALEKQRRDLRHEHRATSTARDRLRAELAELTATRDRARRGAEQDIVRDARVVASTLATFRLRDEVYGGPYDVVLVDEAGSARMAELIVAIAKAKTTAVLFGDFRQLGPIGDDRVAHPAADRWIARDGFAAVGITTPSRAASHPGCTVLAEQYRFGDDIMQLANDVAYDGRLRAGVPLNARRHDGAEIVLIDTDRLGDLGTIRRSGRHKGWWPAGSLLARALAEHHGARDESVGVVAPYSLQVEATLEAIRDVESEAVPMLAEVGTAHRLQGREFDVVVFDLVEGDNGTPGRLGTATHMSDDDFVRSGIRLFNVGITRARRRLYLITGLRALRSWKAGPVPRAILRMIDDGRIRTMAGADLLGIASSPASEDAPVDPLHDELTDAFRRHVRVVGIDDETTFFATLARYLAQARASVWMWAPWVGKRAEDVVPRLVDAARRRVDVRVFVRSGKEADPAHVAELERSGCRVIRYDNMHQKTVVIDERVTMLGSLNMLSHTGRRGGTHDVMVVHEGRRFARQLLDHEHAETLSRPPRAEVCGHSEQIAEVWRSATPNRNYAWRWRCPKCLKKWPIPSIG